jgi:carbonic anhydrase
MNILNGSVLAVFTLFQMAALAADSNDQWGYQGKNGPAVWGRLQGSYARCGIGEQQSPINITATRKENLPAIEFHYQPSELRVLNDGHTVQVNVDAGSYITIGMDRFRLTHYQVHVPGEGQIQGKTFDMSLHLVHANDAGELAVAAVLFREGKKNDVLQPLWQNLPTVKSPERVLAGLRLNPAGLLPVNRSYYSFEGSLTTPPCREGVRWFVLKEPVEMSKGQVFRLKAIFHSNARPVQPLNGRVVKESQ